MKIYTKTGDGGTTSLIGGRRVSKAHPRVEAYGTVDELSGHIAYLRDNMPEGTFTAHREELFKILKDLMAVESVFASDGGASKFDGDGGLAWLEERIDSMQALLTPLSNFTIPGGHPLVSLSHIARTVCRRAERTALRIDNPSDMDNCAVRYLNRLSDYLYALGRDIARLARSEEVLWEPGK